MRNSPVPVLDEPTSGLDAESEREVIKALKHQAKGKTVIVVTHQLSTINQRPSGALAGDAEQPFHGEPGGYDP